MKLVILAGGYGTRISEETSVKPKPLVEIGGRPIIWHIMKMYSHYGINEFVVCLGYKGYLIKEYFANYYRHLSDLTIDMGNNTETYHRTFSEDWKVTLIDTGEGTLTGGRIKRIADYVSDDDAFCMTYGDGVSDVNIADLIQAHKDSGKKATLTAVRPSSRFGSLVMDGTLIKQFKEKPIDGEGYINGGFFVLSPDVFNYIDGDQTIWERDPLERLAQEGELNAYKHEGFWQPMDTLRDKQSHEKIWESRQAPWKLW